jgi:hypothetical protein
MIILAGTNSDCSAEIISGRIIFNLLDITLEAILNKTLHKLIVQYWVEDCDFELLI